MGGECLPTEHGATGSRRVHIHAARDQAVPKGEGAMTTIASDTKVTRLSININEETAAALRDMAARRGVSVTEAVRRAVAIAKFVEDETMNGSTVQVDDGK